MADLGITLALTTDEGLDLDPGFGLVSGRRALAQAILARLDTPQGTLWYDPDYGRDLKRWLNESFAPSDVFRVQSEIEAECLKDERVRDVAATVTFEPQAERLRVVLALTDADGPFELVLAVSAVSLEVLRGE